MIPKGLFTQIGMVAISVAIIVMYVQPQFQEIGKVQDNISTYQDERARVSQVNERLRALMSQLESIPIRDQERLLRYMPNASQVDRVGVPRDLSIIAEEAGVVFKSAFYTDSNEAERPADDTDVQYPDVHHFTFEVEGTYQQIKTLLSLMEQNQYPLQIESLEISPLDGSFLNAVMDIRTFSFNSERNADEIVF